jgi:class 3 adenylate cyclase/tetratricopeptide (TPR) repeat protein
MRCSKCGGDNRQERKFCAECGARLVAACAKCGAGNEPGEKFCGECGVTLTDSAEPKIAQSRQASDGTSIHVISEPANAQAKAIDGERKTVTALFADIKGSTELMEKLDPEEARAVIDPVLQLMMDAVHRYDGYVVQSAGDGIFALFGAPVGHEDHPQRAVHAAIAMRTALHRRDVDQPGRPAVEIRIGINTGEVVLRLVHTGGHTEYTPVGHAANLAARMQSAAPADGIVISADTQRLVEGYFELRESGPTEVKGVAEPINIYEVIGAGPLHGHFDLAVRRGLTKFVGREGELKQMVHALELARGGHGQMVAVVAEAGTGKSRLFYEFKATLPADCKVLEAYSVSHGKASAWLPVLALLHDYFGIQEANAPATRREKLRAVLAALDPALSDTQPYLFALLAIAESPDPIAQMDTQIKRKLTMEALKRIMLRESVKQPVVIIFEDLHWIDGETQALLDLLADGIGNARALMLVNYRPEYRHEWGNKSYYSQLRLDPLGRESVAEMLSTLLGGGVELDPLKRLITERTDGNPFFIEEMVQALFDQGAIVRNGTVKVARSLSQLRLPPTVQGILASRIDRLGLEQKELLQTMAVIGRESSVALIRKIASCGDGELEQMLSALQAGEFIYEAPSASGVEYTFKHALTQEVAYNSLLLERRKLLHERAGQALESIFAENLDDHLAELAHHYNHSDNVEKAIEYLERAGQQCIQRSANADAVGNLTAAIGMLRKLPHSPEIIRRELLLQLALSVGLAAVKGLAAAEVERTISRAMELCKLLGDTPELFPALVGLWTLYFIRAEFRAAYGLAERLMAQAQGKNDSALPVVAHFALGDTSFNMGNLLLAREHLEAVISLYDSERHGAFAVRTFVDLKANALSYVAMTLWTLGYPDQALVRAYEAVEFAQALRHLHSLAGAECFLAIVQEWLSEKSDAQVTAERLIALSTEQGLPLWLALGMVQSGSSIAERGDDEKGISLWRKV